MRNSYSDEELQTEMKKAYRQGYRRGKNWDRDWYPGGPDSNCTQTEKIRNEWLRGFDNGLAKKNSLPKNKTK